MITVWTVIKRFLIGWAVTGVVLVIVSCIKYKQFIMTAFSNNIWAWVNTAMPVLIAAVGIFYILKSVFR